MTLGSWDPKTADSTASFSIDPHQLQHFIKLAQGDQLDDLSEQLNEAQIQQQAALMQLPETDWLMACDALPSSDLLALIRFFTIAEDLPGWQCGEKSPVIWLTRIIKKRGGKLDKELLIWIRTNSNNRFLPYGSL